MDKTEKNNDKTDKKNKSVWHWFLCNANKIDRLRRDLKKYESGFFYNPKKADAIEKTLDELYRKEEEYRSRFTEKDIETYEEYYGVPFED